MAKLLIKGKEFQIQSKQKYSMRSQEQVFEVQQVKRAPGLD